MSGPSSRPSLFQASMYQAYRLGRRLYRIPTMRRLVPERFKARVQGKLHGNVVDVLPDRRYMREALLPALAAMRTERLLDVGVQDYSHGHASMLPECEYWTLDLDPDSARLVPADRHVVANVMDAAEHFQVGFFDVVLLNGTFGFGTDTLDDQERAIAAVSRILRPGGWLLIGWNMDGDGRPFTMAPTSGEPIRPPGDLSIVAERFSREAPAGLPRHLEFTDCSHVYDWFRLREARRDGAAADA